MLSVSVYCRCMFWIKIKLTTANSTRIMYIYTYIYILLYMYLQYIYIYMYLWVGGHPSRLANLVITGIFWDLSGRDELLTTGPTALALELPCFHSTPKKSSEYIYFRDSIYFRMVIYIYKSIWIIIVHPICWSTLPSGYVKIAIENDPFIVDFHIKNGDSLIQKWYIEK